MEIYLPCTVIEEDCEQEKGKYFDAIAAVKDTRNAKSD